MQRNGIRVEVVDLEAEDLIDDVVIEDPPMEEVIREIYETHARR